MKIQFQSSFQWNDNDSNKFVLEMNHAFFDYTMKNSVLVISLSLLQFKQNATFMRQLVSSLTFLELSPLLLSRARLNATNITILLAVQSATKFYEWNSLDSSPPMLVKPNAKSQ